MSLPVTTEEQRAVNSFAAEVQSEQKILELQRQYHCTLFGHTANRNGSVPNDSKLKPLQSLANIMKHLT